MKPPPILGLLISLSLFTLTGCTSGPSAIPNAKEAEQPTRNLDGDRLALEGYDPVAYFPEGGGEPARGHEDLAATHLGVTYRFVSPEHRAAFRQDPGRYTPAYGGWCAYAMADGQKVEVDPEAFVIQNDRLMVFYRTWLTDTRDPWNADAQALEAKADAAWEAISRGEPSPPIGDE